MVRNPNDMSKSTENTNGQAVVPQKIDGNQLATSIGTFQSFLKSRMPTIQSVAAKHLDPNRVFRLVVVAVSKTPALQRCTMESIFRCVVQSVELGLEPGSAIGEGYLVPFKDQCTFIPGYRGLISLAFRSGHVKSVSAFCVYQGDHFEFELGLEPKIKHIPKMDAERDVKDITFAYAIVELKDGGRVYDVMSRGEVDKIRARSKASQNGPWVTDFAEMARKTVTRRCLKYAPMSVEMSKALSLEDSIDTGTNYMDAEFTSLDFEAVERSTKTETIKDKIPDAPNANPETGEVIDEPQETLI